MPPYQALYGLPAPNPLVAPGVEVSSAEVREWLQERKRLTTELKDRLQIAQNRMKQQADKHRKEKVYSMGDWVYLKLQPYRQGSLTMRGNPKLSARYYDPFEIIERIGKVAYKLSLPEESRIHHVFHISQLKNSPGDGNKVIPTTPLVGEEGQLLAEPERVLERRMVKHGKNTAAKVLVKWSNLPIESTTWEDSRSLKQQFPQFDS